MKPIQCYDSVYQYPISYETSDAMDRMARQIIPLVVCLDGIIIVYVSDDGEPSWHHYHDIPPPHAMERIESLALAIAKHYPLS